MAFQDLAKWFDAGLQLPWGGKVYSIPAVSGELGIRLQALMDHGMDVARAIQAGEGKDGVPEPKNQELLNDLEERELYQECLGPVYQELMDDGAPWSIVKLAAMTTMIDTTMDRDTAEKYWNSGGKGIQEETPASKPSATAVRAKKPASTVGTTSRRATRAKGSSGHSSSRTGR